MGYQYKKSDFEQIFDFFISMAAPEDINLEYKKIRGFYLYDP